MEEMKIMRPFDILDVIESLGKIVRRPVMKGGLKTDRGNNRVIVERVAYFPASMMAFGSK